MSKKKSEKKQEEPKPVKDWHTWVYGGQRNPEKDKDWPWKDEKGHPTSPSGSRFA